jgi:DNA primase
MISPDTIEESKRRVTIESLVADAGLEVSYSHNIRCPFHEDDSPSLRIYPDGHWHCYGCGKYGDSLDWLGYLLHGESYDSHDHLRDVIDHIGALDIRPVPKPRVPIQVAALDLGYAATSYHNNITTEARDYFNSRGLTDETISKYRLGWDSLLTRYTIPAYYRGFCFGIKKRRSLPEESQPEKYISEKSSRVGLFNSDVLITADWCVIVEGEIDCMTLDQAGFPCVSTTGGAKTFRPKWARFFAQCQQVFVIYDNDDPGREGVLLVRSVIARAKPIYLPKKYKDVNEYALDGNFVGELLC